MSRYADEVIRTQVVADRAGTRSDDVREAALTLFARWGYHGTTMSQIAHELGVRTPTLYSHIQSKQGILADIMVATTTQVWNDFSQAVAAADGVPDSLSRAVHAYVLRHATHRREALIVNRDISCLDEPVRSKVLDARRRHAHAIRDLIDAGVGQDVFHVDEASIASFAILEMGVSVARWFRDEGRLTASAVAHRHAQLALNMVRYDG